MSIILAKILGLYFLAIGLAFLINPDRFRKIYDQIMDDENFLLLGGIMALLIGSVIISIHNIWEWSWVVVITVLGWWSFIKGLLLLICPHSVKLYSFLQNRSNFFYRGLSFIMLVLGLFLIYKGWQFLLS